MIVRLYTVPAAVTPELRRQLAHYAGGYTILAAEGGWLDDSDNLIAEPSAVIELVVDDTNGLAIAAADYAISAVEQAARKVGEKAVLVTYQAARSEMRNL